MPNCPLKIPKTDAMRWSDAVSFSTLFSIPQQEEPSLTSSKVVFLKAERTHGSHTAQQARWWVPGCQEQGCLSRRGLLSPITVMANAAKTPAMRMPFMMLGLASPKDGNTEPQTWEDTKREAWDLGEMLASKVS